MINPAQEFIFRPWLAVPLCAAMLHTTYAIGLIIEPAIGHITAIHLLWVMMESAGAVEFLPAVFLVVAGLSIVPFFVRLHAEHIHLCLWPQQTVLFLMTASAFSASLHGTYPDGYMQTSMFIFTDQSYAPYLMFAHLAVTIRNAVGGRYGATNGQYIR